MQGAKHLGENISRAPALVIPTVIGRHDGSGRPGLFDSVIQSAWSFMVALRARGLGTVWTTMYLNEADAVAELLDLPDDVTQICLFPVAYTVGTDFKATSRRYPARDITYFDRYGRTLAEGRSEPRSIVDGPGQLVEIDIKARPEIVWEFVSDVNLSAEFSEEFQGGEWDDPDGDSGVGSTFTGHNKHPQVGEWSTTSHVTVWDPPREFAWSVADPRGARRSVAIHRREGSWREPTAVPRAARPRPVRTDPGDRSDARQRGSDRRWSPARTPAEHATCHRGNQGKGRNTGCCRTLGSKWISPLDPEHVSHADSAAQTTVQGTERISFEGSDHTGDRR